MLVTNLERVVVDLYIVPKQLVELATHSVLQHHAPSFLDQYRFPRAVKLRASDLTRPSSPPCLRLTSRLEG